NATGSWIQEAKLVASDGAPGDRFGESVSIHDDTAIVGATDSGSAYVFVRNAPGDWTQQDKFSTSGGGDGFGWSVGISNNTFIVGAYLDDDNGNDSGAAYIYSP
ncbi:hypothetical protein ACHAXR_003454, partial [Thalassiosira sp. AJA248-18]